MTTMKAMRPPETEGAHSAIDKTRALARYDDDTERYLQIIADADGLDLRRIKVASPFLRIARFNLGGLIKALGVHAIRHVEQAERVTRMDAFPAQATTA